MTNPHSASPAEPGTTDETLHPSSFILPPSRVGLDVGFGITKAVAYSPTPPLPARSGERGPGGEGDEHRTVAFPSVLGQAQALDSYRVGIASRRRARTRPIAFDGATYYVGDDALHHSRAQGMRQDRHRIGSDQELILALYALARMDVADALVVTGVPVIWWDHRRDLVKRWTGQHTVTYCGRQRTVAIHQVRVVPQPFGGFYSWALDDTGRAAIQEADMLKPYAMLDIGWNTTDMTAVDGLRPVERWSGGEAVGARRISEIVRDAVQRQTGLTLDIHEADRALSSRQVVAYGEDVDIGPVVDSAIAAVAEQVRARATELWGDGGRFKAVFIFGGGGALMGRHLLAAFPRNGVLLPDPATANARGFARYAQRPATFTLKTPPLPVGEGHGPAQPGAGG